MRLLATDIPLLLTLSGGALAASAPYEAPEHMHMFYEQPQTLRRVASFEMVFIKTQAHLFPPFVWGLGHRQFHQRIPFNDHARRFRASIDHTPILAALHWAALCHSSLHLAFDRQPRGASLSQNKYRAGTRLIDNRL